MLSNFQNHSCAQLPSYKRLEQKLLYTMYQKLLPTFKEIPPKVPPTCIVSTFSHFKVATPLSTNQMSQTPLKQCYNIFRPEVALANNKI